MLVIPISLRRERRLRLLAFSILLLVASVVILTINNLLASFVLAVVITYLLSPLVFFLERQHVPRQIAILVPFLIAGLLIAFGVYKVLPLMVEQAKALEQSAPQYQRDLLDLIRLAEDRFKFITIGSKLNLNESIQIWLAAKTADLSRSLPGLISRSLTILLLAPLFAFFMLQDGRAIFRSVLGIVPNNFFEMGIDLQHKINQQMGSFVRARLLESLIVGAIVWIGLVAIDFPYATLLAAFCALTNLIPYIGPIIGAVPALIIAVVSSEAQFAATPTLNLAIVTGIYFLAQLIDILFVIPMVVARIVNLHPVAVIIVIIIGAQLMGIMGMVISIPVASVIKLVGSAVYDHAIDSTR